MSILYSSHANNPAPHSQPKDHAPRVNLRVILHREDLLLAERRVVVETHLGIGGNQVALVVLSERVDLCEGMGGGGRVCQERARGAGSGGRALGSPLTSPAPEAVGSAPSIHHSRSRHSPPITLFPPHRQRKAPVPVLGRETPPGTGLPLPRLPPPPTSTMVQSALAKRLYRPLICSAAAFLSPVTRSPSTMVAAWASVIPCRMSMGT